MNEFLRYDPIVTISTSMVDKCAIGIIRLSGFKDLNSLSSLIGLNAQKVKPRYAHYVKLSNDGMLLDDGILLFFPGPNSYTGENLLELQVHGNPINLKRIEKHLVENYDFKRAMPGEFTYRAYRNKRLTLAQIEGLDLILNSNTAIGLDSGLSTLNGKLYNHYLNLRDAFYQLCTSIEISIDFSEDVGEGKAKDLLLNAFHDLDKKIKILYKQSRGSLNQLLKPEIAFFGETNAGKSSLFNKLLGDNRAIVSDVAGTTRDFISEYIHIDENVFRLTDTAGFRDTVDTIESEGIKRAESLRETVFSSIYIINPFSNHFHKLVNNLNDYDYIVFTHNDQSGFLECLERESIDFSNKNFFMSGLDGPIEPLISLKSGPIEQGKKIGPIEPKKISSRGSIGPKIGSGPIEPLLESINSRYLDAFSKNLINIERHRLVIEEIYNCWINVDYSNNINDLGLLSHEVFMVKPHIEELIGIVAPDDVLNNIFNNFCIGK